MEINVHNLKGYLLQHTDLLNANEPVTVTELNQDSDPYAEGYVNFVFRVRQGNKGYIVKQARTYLKVEGIAHSLTVTRNYLEYVSFVLRKAILNKYIPHIYHVDKENSLFVMEELDQYKIMRFQLSAGKKFDSFPAQIGEFIAKIQFFTSDLYLSKEVFCELNNYFLSAGMRSIMEDKVLLRAEELVENGKGPAMLDISNDIWNNPKIRIELMEIRDVFIKKWECLIHGDLHTSNIFIGNGDLFVIDMEYSFMAPFGYDLGYLLANFISQYAAFHYNNSFTMSERAEMQAYLLHTIESVLDEYFKVFAQCFYDSAKPVYKKTPGYLERLFKNILEDAIGFMASANMSRVLNLVTFPDFDCIRSPELCLAAKGLSLAIDERLIFERKHITSQKQLIEVIRCAGNEYLEQVYRP